MASTELTTREMARNMIGESVWFEQPRVEAAENVYQEAIAQCHSGLEVVVGTQLVAYHTV